MSELARIFSLLKIFALNKVYLREQTAIDQRGKTKNFSMENTFDSTYTT